MYRVKSKWERGMSQSELVLVDAIATSTEATRELWRYLFGVDLIAKRVAVELRPGDAALSHGEGRPQAPAEARRRHLAAARRRRRGAAAALVRRRRLGRARGDGRLLLLERGSLPRRRGRGPDRGRRGAAALGCRPRVRRTSARSRSSAWPRPAGWRSSPSGAIARATALFRTPAAAVVPEPF